MSMSGGKTDWEKKLYVSSGGVAQATHRQGVKLCVASGWLAQATAGYWLLLCSKWQPLNLHLCICYMCLQAAVCEAGA